MLAGVAGKAARRPKNIIGPQVARLRYQLGLSQTELVLRRADCAGCLS